MYHYLIEKLATPTRSMYYYLVYSSTSTPLFLKRDIDNILALSRKNNLEQEITGLLLYHNDNFIQVLEGNEDQVKNLYQTISNDKRHTLIMKIIEGYTFERQFPDWSMAYRELSDVEYDTVHGEIALSANKVLDRTQNTLSSPVAVLLKRFLPEV